MYIKFLKAFAKATHKERFEFFQLLLHNAKESFVNYWFGYVDVYKQTIRCIDNKIRLSSFSICVGKHGKGQWFSEMEASELYNLIENIKTNTYKFFKLHVDLGCGAYQDYVFDRYQCKLLLTKLEELLKKYEVYKEENN